MNFFITAIHTDSGKTICSAIICEALAADYWKPVQCGSPHDAQLVKELISNEKTKIYPETYQLNAPQSPHAAAAREGIRINMDQFRIPETTNTLVIEGAGGCLVPLNESNFVIDIASKFDLGVILVSNFYLGSINHTLLTFEALKKRNVRIEGIVFNGIRNEQTEKIILHHTQLPCLLHIAQEENINREIIKKYAEQFAKNWIR